MEQPIGSPVKSNPCGKLISSSQKVMIINLYKSKIAANPNFSLRELRIKISKGLGIGQTTISRTITEYKNNKTISSPNRSRVVKNVNKKIDDFDIYTIRKLIYQFWFNRELPTLDKILTHINEKKDLPDFTRTALHKLLKKLNFEHTKRGQNSSIIEKNEIILWRRKYLREIRRYREEGRPIYYLDETWVPTGEGKRLIVFHIGSVDGFLPGGLLSFESKKNTNDYHDEINDKTFQDWLESVLPRLKQNTVIVMDNAPYHSAKQEKIPLRNWKKEDIISWLESKGEILHTPMIMVQLMEIVARLKPQYNKYVIDEMASAYNKTILRLPPYHCELNPIEKAWSVIKSHVKFHNKTFKMADVKNLIVEGVEKVDSDMWKKFIRSTVDEEEKLWNIDFIVDELMEEQQDHLLTLDDSDADYESNV